MSGLLGDGWFYISSAGLLVSGVLFFFLLGQYRAAMEAADVEETESAVAPVQPVYVTAEPPEDSTQEAVASVAPRKEAEKTVVLTPPAEAPAASAPERRPEAAAAAPASETTTTTGGISPAVVYLQNIKNQLDGLQLQIGDLKKRMDAIGGRDEALIDRLTELAHDVAEMKSSAAASTPASKAAKAAELSLKIEPAAAPEAASASTPPETPQTSAAEPKPEGEEPRRGPVWPV